MSKKHEYHKKISALFEDIKPILIKHGVLEEGSKMQIITSTLNATANFIPCDFSKGCYYQNIPNSNGGSTTICVCPPQPNIII